MLPLLATALLAPLGQTTHNLQGCVTWIKQVQTQTPSVRAPSSCWRSNTQTVGVGGSGSRCSRAFQELVFFFPLDELNGETVVSATL